MSALETRIDALYALPLAEFTAARNALAQSLAGDDRARVKRLEKPTVVPWAVNQIYWHERAAWNRVMATGLAFRSAQLAALTGHGAGLRDATTAHAAAVAAAVAAADHLSARHGAHPATDELSRMLEAIALAPAPPAAPGRFTEAVQPAGFEALAGFTPPRLAPRPTQPRESPPPKHGGASGKTSAAQAERRRAAAAEARAAAEAAVAEARATLATAEAEAAEARKAADAAKRVLVQAEYAAQTAHVVVERARAVLHEREARLRSM